MSKRVGRSGDISFCMEDRFARFAANVCYKMVKSDFIHKHYVKDSTSSLIVDHSKLLLKKNKYSIIVIITINLFHVDKSVMI